MHIAPQTNDDNEDLIQFLTSEPWQYFGLTHISKEKATEWINKDKFNSETSRSFWIINENNEKIGHLRRFDLEDSTPLFDIRILSKHRKKGIGRYAVNWLTQYFFENFPEVQRFEAQTRHDNIGMRKVLKKCNFVKEAHYRKSWPDESGKIFDGVGYAILREDWESEKITPVNWNDETF
jgi:RimJ/RimL family protein N-acetyltransferase